MVDGPWWLGHGGGSGPEESGIRPGQQAGYRSDLQQLAAGRSPIFLTRRHKRYLVAQAANGVLPPLGCTALRIGGWVGLELGRRAADAMRWLVLVWANMCVCG